MPRKFLRLCPFIFVISSTVFADAVEPYLKTDAFVLSEPISIDAALNEWAGTYQTDGKNQIASMWLETGVKKGDWSYGALYREEHQIGFSSDTADLYYAVANDNDLTPGRQYTLDLDAYRFRALGARVSRSFEASDNLKITAGASLFHASNLLDGALSGIASADSDDQYGFNFAVDYQYDEDVLLDRPGVESPHGIGLSLDFNLHWQASNKLQIHADVKDLIGAIYWKDVPFTTATATSEIVTVDEDGFSQVNPVLSGVEGYHDNYTQTLRPTANLSAQYQLSHSPYFASVKSKHYQNLSLFGVGGSRNLAGGNVTLHYWPEIKTLEAKYQSKRFSLSLGLDDFQLSDAHAFWLSLSIPQ